MPLKKTVGPCPTAKAVLYYLVFLARGRHGFDMHGRRVKAHVRGGDVTRLLKAYQRLFGNEYALAA